MPCDLKYTIIAHKRNRNLLHRRYIYRAFSYVMITLALSLNLVLVYYLKKRNIVSPIIHYHAYSFTDTSCFNANESSLPKLDNFTSDKRIFFHEISCKGGLNSRQACSIESAARANPGWRIDVLFLGSANDIFLNGQLYKVLKNRRNVKFSKILIEKYVKDTPLERMVLSDLLLMNNEGKLERLNEVMRYITLYKHGGVYLDLDVIVVNSFDGLDENWVGKLTPNELGAGAMGFSNNELGRKVANATMFDLLLNSNPLLASDSASVMNRVLKDICSTSWVPNMTLETCKGFNVYSEVFFYPVHWQNTQEYTAFRTLPLAYTYISYVHHMWSSIYDQSRISKRSRYGKLAKMFCPDVFSLYGNEFGI